MNPQKKTEQFIYTESVFYDVNGVEVARERNYDDAWYDTLSVEDATEDEISDYGLDGE